VIAVRIRLVLPLPPSVNRIYKRSRSGGVFLDKKVREFRQEVAAAAERAGFHPISGRFRARVTLYPASNRKFDGDNREKALWDALEKCGVIDNDLNNFDCHRLVGGVSPPDGGCVVELEEIQ
jgi:Holliday junction resolvase RusA-like endonuclease